MMRLLSEKYKPLKTGKRGRMIRICDLFLELNKWQDGDLISQYITRKNNIEFIVISKNIQGADNNHVYKIRKYQGYLFCSLNVERLRLLIGDDFDQKLYQYTDDKDNLFLSNKKI